MSEGDDTALSTRAAALVGTVLKQKWRLDEVLGIGGMATVFSATHRNQKRVAIKMLHPAYSVDPKIRERFLREGYTANAVGHRGAVSVDDDDVAEDGSAFLVMELLHGEGIETRLARLGNRMPIEEVLGIADQLLDVLIAAHTKGIVHRDIKPDNLFLMQNGILKVLDFGIAQLMTATSETCIGAIMGTPAFMAPEQARARWELVDGQTDLWSVGATIFTLLSGRFVHESRTLNEQLGLAMWADARSITTVLPDLPKPLVSFLDRATAYRKQARFPDAGTMQNELRWAWQEISAPSKRPALNFADRAIGRSSDPNEDSGRLAVFVDLEQALERAAQVHHETSAPTTAALSTADVLPGEGVDDRAVDDRSTADDFSPDELSWQPRRPQWAIAGGTVALALAAAAALVMAVPRSRSAVNKLRGSLVAFVSDRANRGSPVPLTVPPLTSVPGPAAPDPPTIEAAPSPDPDPAPSASASPTKTTISPQSSASIAHAAPARRPQPVHPSSPSPSSRPKSSFATPPPSSPGSTPDPKDRLERSLLGPAVAPPIGGEDQVPSSSR
jgi:serine/threonine-protein kinase